jgi:hypothetical protein
MAEPVGLTLGVVALVSLFSSCVELVNYFELGRSCEYDYSVACLKLSLLRSRLESWGHTLRVRDTDHEAKALRRSWLQEEDVVERSLLGIKSLFGDAELLKDKYKLMPRTSTTLSRSQAPRSKSALAEKDQTSSRYLSKCSRFSLFRQSTKWAIRDKDKFDAFLHDLEFFISNLEHVQSRLEMSQRFIQEAEERCGVEGKNLNTTPQCREIPSDQVQVRSVTDSGNDGRSWEQNGTKFKIGKISDHALYFQGVQGEVSATCLESDEKTSYTVDEMSGQATGMQGYNSAQSIRDMLESRRAMLIDRYGSVRSGESRTDEQKHTQRNGPGRVLGK